MISFYVRSHIFTVCWFYSKTVKLCIVSGSCTVLVAIW